MPSTPNDVARLLAVDAILIKAANLGSEAVFHNLERRVVQFMVHAWQPRAVRALMAARAHWMYGMTAAEMTAAIAKPFKGWERELQPIIEAATRDSYGEAKRQIMRRALGQMGPIGKSLAPVQKAPKDPSIETGFNLRDERAIEQLVKGQLRWIGQYYDSQLSETIDTVVNEVMFQTGMGREEAGRALEAKLTERLAVAGMSIPEGWTRGPTAYFELIAANTASNGRVRGSFAQMADIGVSHYTVVAIGDERTCGRCSFMDGRSFTVAHATELLDQIAAADTPEQVRALHPWASHREQMEADPDKFRFPPYHGECRCTVDIAEDSEITF